MRLRWTALLLATLIDGEVFAFPVVPGAFIAVARDGSGLAVEVYPDGMAHHPGKGHPDASITPQGPQAQPWEDQVHPDGQQLRPTAFHLALVSKLGDEAVMELARRNGLRGILKYIASVPRMRPSDAWISVDQQLRRPAASAAVRRFSHRASRAMSATITCLCR